MNDFIVNSNLNYTDLICYQKAVVIYDLTYHFCERFIDKRDRTYDQMLQAARSEKQNIVEGYIDKESSMEMAIKLMNVARGSLKELLEDYTDYLRTRGKRIWERDSNEVTVMRSLGINHSDSQYFISMAESRSDEVVANMVIILLYQADTLISRYIKSLEGEFSKNGGIKEKMYKIRKKVTGS